MNTKNRIRCINLYNLTSKHPDFAKEIGLEVRFKETDKNNKTNNETKKSTKDTQIL